MFDHSFPTQDLTRECQVDLASVIVSYFDKALVASAPERAEIVSLLRAVLRPRRALRVLDVRDRTKDSHGKFYARMNPSCREHDPSFPTPFYLGRSPRWWEHDVDTWLDLQAATSTTRH